MSTCSNASILKFLKAFKGEEGLLTSAILHDKKPKQNKKMKTKTKPNIFPVKKPSFHCGGQKNLKADKEVLNQLWLSKRTPEDKAPI